jgi:uncharacterized LabA/DUF88 family protein
MTWYKDEKLAIFIDGSNLYGAARALEFDIDYKRLLTWAAKQGKLIRAYYYTALVEDNEFSPIRPLVDWLDYNGYTMVTKIAREYTDANGRRKIKGNIDVEMTCDVLEICDKVDHVMLFTGDGDFKRLVESIQRKAIRISVVSTVETHPPMIADELRRHADHFIDLNDLRNEIKRADSPARSTPTDTESRPVRDAVTRDTIGSSSET